MPLSRIGLSQNQQITGNVAFQGTSNRITGDFSNATVANRVMFQTSTTNAQTQILAIPNGTSTQAVFEANSDSSGGTNAVIGQIGVIAGVEVRINSGIRGTGTYQPMTFHTGGTETARFSSTAKTFILAGGSTSATGTGITFPASQNASSDANTLDDYEEGLWTPTFTASGASFTYNVQTGTYVKVGSLVFAQFYLRVTAYSGTNSNITITGLPFTSVNINGFHQSPGCMWSTTSTQAVALIQNNTTVADLWKQGTSVTIFTASEIINGYFVGSFTYRAT